MNTPALARPRLPAFVSAQVSMPEALDRLVRSWLDQGFAALAEPLEAGVAIAAADALRHLEIAQAELPDIEVVAEWATCLTELPYAKTGDALENWLVNLMDGAVLSDPDTRPLPRAAFNAQTRAMAIRKFDSFPAPAKVIALLEGWTCRHIRTPALALRQWTKRQAIPVVPAPAALQRTPRGSVPRLPARWVADTPDKAAARERSLAAVRDD